MVNGIFSKESLVDIFSAFVTTFAVSPTNTIIDKAVIQYANGRQTVRQGITNGFSKLFKTPIVFLKSFQFKWMYFVYIMTYSANNLSDHSNIIPGLSIPLQNLLITFVVNTACGISKDKAYIQHFAAIKIRPFPATTLGLLFLRDLITVASAFTIPPIFSKMMQKRFGVSQRASLTGAQLLSPLLIQIIVTPLHLLGLDLYNRQGLKLTERFKYIKGLYLNTVMLRMIRFLPAYGIGGVINTQLRKSLKHKSDVEKSNVILINQ